MWSSKKEMSGSLETSLCRSSRLLVTLLDTSHSISQKHLLSSQVSSNDKEILIKDLLLGDTLFLMGCGRLFEGTASQMWNSMSKLKTLPPETKVYCGHEYTQANAKFAVATEPNNEALIQRKNVVDEMRSKVRNVDLVIDGLGIRVNPLFQRH